MECRSKTRCCRHAPTGAPIGSVLIQMEHREIYRVSRPGNKRTFSFYQMLQCQKRVLDTDVEWFCSMGFSTS